MSRATPLETEAPAASAVSEIESSSSDDERSEEGSVRPAGAGARTGAGPLRTPLYGPAAPDAKFDAKRSSIRVAAMAVPPAVPLTDHGLLPWAGVLLWPLLLTLPLMLSSPLSVTSYREVFPAGWYEYDPATDDPKPLGLTLGLLAVVIGQVFVLAFFSLYRGRYLTRGVEPTPVQAKGARAYTFGEGIRTHLFQPEGFVLLGLYLSLTWMFGLMPPSYYSFEGSIQWTNLVACLVLQDGIQYAMHMAEHQVSVEMYKISHKPHHRFTNPRLFDAFNGSMADTILMILIPLYSTANIVRTCNVWTYMAFGSMYANWLTLIHSEYALPWDCIFRKFGLGTPGDHHVHHKLFKYNFGHLFMWFDMVGGTYRRPERFAPRVFNKGI